MIGIDFDPLPLLSRDRALLVDRLEDARDGRARKTQEEDALTWLSASRAILAAFRIETVVLPDPGPPVTS